MYPNDPIPLAVSFVGLFSSIILYLSAFPVIAEIVSSKDVMHYKFEPFVIGLVYSVAKTPYPVINFQLGPVISSGVSMFLYGVYYGIYVVHAPITMRMRIYGSLVKALACTVFVESSGPVIFWLTLEKSDALRFIEIWLGACSTIAVVLLMSNQLATIRQVVKEKNSKYISGWMLAGNIFCATCWSIYSALILDPFYITANVLGDAACVVQIIAKLRYRNTETSSKISVTS